MNIFPNHLRAHCSIFETSPSFKLQFRDIRISVDTYIIIPKSLHWFYLNFYVFVSFLLFKLYIQLLIFDEFFNLAEIINISYGTTFQSLQ